MQDFFFKTKTKTSWYKTKTKTFILSSRRLETNTLVSSTTSLDFELCQKQAAWQYFDVFILYLGKSLLRIS